jgi:hypothetical protein
LGDAVFDSHPIELAKRYLFIARKNQVALANGKSLTAKAPENEPPDASSLGLGCYPVWHGFLARMMPVFPILGGKATLAPAHPSPNNLDSRLGPWEAKGGHFRSPSQQKASVTTAPNRYRHKFRTTVSTILPP